MRSQYTLLLKASLVYQKENASTDKGIELGQKPGLMSLTTEPGEVHILNSTVHCIGVKPLQHLK